ncbi:MAG: YigZ family protein [Xanthomonadaceae bacterium]|nr:YigZ family protein [Xanthomonadaceae bacterium]
MPTATLAAPARFEQRVRHSRFLAVATSVDAAAAATAWIAAQSDAAASHHCWAYRIGDAYRFSDDGEPAGTAGHPILQAIDGQGLDHVAVLVSRWFGGIKLGAGGLVRAYGGTAAECLRTAPRRPLHKLITANVQAAPAALARLRGRLAQFEATLELAAIADTTLTLRLPAEQLPALERWLADQTRGQGRCRAT